MTVKHGVHKTLSVLPYGHIKRVRRTRSEDMSQVDQVMERGLVKNWW